MTLGHTALSHMFMYVLNKYKCRILVLETISPHAFPHKRMTQNAKFFYSGVGQTTTEKMLEDNRNLDSLTRSNTVGSLMKKEEMQQKRSKSSKSRRQR